MYREFLMDVSPGVSISKLQRYEFYAKLLSLYQNKEYSQFIVMLKAQHAHAYKEASTVEEHVECRRLLKKSITKIFDKILDDCNLSREEFFILLLNNNENEAAVEKIKNSKKKYTGWKSKLRVAAGKLFRRKQKQVIPSSVTHRLLVEDAYAKESGDTIFIETLADNVVVLKSIHFAGDSYTGLDLAFASVRDYIATKTGFDMSKVVSDTSGVPEVEQYRPNAFRTPPVLDADDVGIVIFSRRESYIPPLSGYSSVTLSPTAGAGRRVERDDELVSPSNIKIS